MYDAFCFLPNLTGVALIGILIAHLVCWSASKKNQENIDIYDPKDDLLEPTVVFWKWVSLLDQTIFDSVAWISGNSEHLTYPLP